MQSGYARAAGGSSCPLPSDSRRPGCWWSGGRRSAEGARDRQQALGCCCCSWCWTRRSRGVACGGTAGSAAGHAPAKRQQQTCSGEVGGRGLKAKLGGTCGICGCSQALGRWTVHRQAASTEGAAQGLQRMDRRLREALAGSRRRAVLQWRALDGRRRRARFGWGRGAGGLVEFLASAFTWSCRRLRMAVGGWLITGAQRRVPIRCVALRWSILLLGLAGTNNTKTQTAQGDSLDNGSRLTCVEGSTGVSECSA